MAEHTRLNEEFVAAIRRELQNRRHALVERREQHWQEREDMFAERPLDSGDNAVRENSVNLSREMAEGEITQVRAIDAALARIDGGNYGICMRCGDEIDLERLRALPFATLCMGCADLDSEARRELERGAKL